MNMSYTPQSLVMTLSLQCNLTCGHCIVEAEPRERERLSLGLIEDVLNQARSVGISSVIIYGGEPLLRTRDLLPETLRIAFANGLPVSIGTNGFWGRTEKQASGILSELEEIASQNNGLMSIGMSVDKYHRVRIPPESIANIIKQHRLGNFPHIRLGVQSFQEDESLNVVGEVFNSCWGKGVCLIESNDLGFIYPATSEEFFEFKQENLPLIARKLQLPDNADEDLILSWLANYFKMMEDFREIVTPTVIARKVDFGEGYKNYLIFPNSNYLIDQIVEKRVINAGRAKNGGNLETDLHYEKGVDFLVIAPNGRAYAYPAQITSEGGVFIGNKPLQDVIEEVARRNSKY